ncbi:cGMP-dependent protein kinase 1 isoform X2 [Toxorhynchites rutilus septentrionalis]|uniref:cGMP-dependent protein kinase 1 isoform X2 n=1 Tax=Toxorhynchites rutilus septentrionalis TaxID=329112 RepID=UPI00247ACA86|nr:cGMP-dependent protein kinase 1 isoform X2 [Toxorhynchites rutilus septentrionalis]
MTCFAKFFSRKHGSFDLPDVASEKDGIVSVRLSTRIYDQEFNPPTYSGSTYSEGKSSPKVPGTPWESGFISAPPHQQQRKTPVLTSNDRISASSQENDRNHHGHETLKETQQRKILLQLALESKLREHPNAEDRKHLALLEREIKELQNGIRKQESAVSDNKSVPVENDDLEVIPPPKTISSSYRSNLQPPKPAVRALATKVPKQVSETSELSDDYDTIPLSKLTEECISEVFSSDEDEPRPPTLPPRVSASIQNYNDEQDDTSQDEEPTPPKLPPPRTPPELDDMITRADHIQITTVESECIKTIFLPTVPPPSREPPPTPIEQSSSEETSQRESQASIMPPKIEELNNSRSGILKKVRKEGVVSDKPEARSYRDIVIQSHAKARDEEVLIKKAITANEFLNNLMDEERLKAVTDSMSPMSFPPSSYIIREGDIGAHFYVSSEGTYEVVVDNKVIKSFGRGVVFGELAILYKAKRFASIRVTTEAKVWMLERKVFQKIMMKSGRKEREENVKFLSTVSILKDLEIEKLHKISDLLKREFYATGSTIIQQGDPGDKFYIIRGGSVNVIKTDRNGVDKLVGTLQRGAYFGEQALLHEDRRLASIVANPPGTECLTLNRIAFNEFLGGLERLREIKLSDEIPRISDSKKAVSEYDHIQLHDLTYIGTLGIGGFGRVELVQYQSRKTFALKYLKKIEMVRQQQQEHAYSEKDIMLSCNSPFIVRLYKTYRDKKYLYFLMEACLGGDVWTILQKNKHFDERTARFMTGCVVEAFEYLHSRNMIYRDLKPENLMLDERGYIKLVDFGFAKRIGANQKTWTFAGTPEYVSPEIILNKGHDRAVDYWALGVFIHELLVGKPPFRGKNHMKTYNAILRGIDIIELPSRIPKKAQVLIKRLCRQIPAERLGYGKNGIADIKNHPWFSAFEWHRLKDRTLQAPLVRIIQSNTDLSNFDEYPKDQDEPPDETSGWDINF